MSTIHYCSVEPHAACGCLRHGRTAGNGVGTALAPASGFLRE
jgi:hypothetical protein